MTTNTHWTDTQRTRLRACIEAGDTIAYWCSDAFGRPSNGGNITIERAAPGVVHTAPGAELCAPGTLHATEQPHRWAGLRVWIVACRGVIGRQHDKLGCREREILGEILPEEAIEPSVAIRVGAGADLAGANLARANLADAYLAGAKGTAKKLPHFQLPAGDLIGWKRCGGHIVKMLIPADAKRTASLVGRKCRAEFVKVLEIDGADEAVSGHDGATVYRVGEVVRPDSYDDNPLVECTHGIHWFATRAEAEEY